MAATTLESSATTSGEAVERTDGMMNERRWSSSSAEHGGSLMLMITRTHVHIFTPRCNGTGAPVPTECGCVPYLRHPHSFGSLQTGTTPHTHTTLTPSHCTTRSSAQQADMDQGRRAVRVTVLCEHRRHAKQHEEQPYERD
jgi:hypothetical protein